MWKKHIYLQVHFLWLRLLCLLSLLAAVVVQELEPFQTEKNALPTRGQQDGAIHIYSLEYINWCESHAFCHIPALNYLPWKVLASLNTKRKKLTLLSINRNGVRFDPTILMHSLILKKLREEILSGSNKHNDS